MEHSEGSLVNYIPCQKDEGRCLMIYLIF